LPNSARLVDELFNWGVEVLKELISVPTINPPGENYGEFVATASRLLSEAGFEDIEIHRVPREIVEKHYPGLGKYPRYILIARKGSGYPVLHFNGHYDVVPPGQGWRHDPFDPVVEEGKLYGRGAVDMKGGIAAAILAARAFFTANPGFKGTFEIALVPDEEIGGETGTGYLVEKELSSPDYVVIAEPSGSGTVWIGHRGAYWFYVEVYGKQAHGSTPWLGVNAFEYMVRVAHDFMTEYRELLSRKKSHYEYDDPRGASPTITLGGEVKGSTKINILPGYYAFSVDRRLIVEESIEEVEEEVNKFIQRLREKYPEVRIEAKPVNKLPPAITPKESKLVVLAKEAVREVAGAEPRLTVCLGGLDMRYYTEKGIETITYGPGPGGAAHQVDEYVELEELRKVAKAYAVLAEKLLAK
jgi:succinyl-diaminopimelate desuccinylase